MPQPNKRIDTGAAIRLKLKGMSYRDIGKKQGISGAAVHQALAPILAQLPNAEQLAEYKQHSADMFQSVSMRMLQSIDQDDIKRITADKRVLSAAVATDKARLISGQSTQNVAMIMASACMSSDED